MALKLLHMSIKSPEKVSELDGPRDKSFSRRVSSLFPALFETPEKKKGIKRKEMESENEGK